MKTVFEKLNLKDQTEILVLHAPAFFEAELCRLGAVQVHRSVTTLARIGFALVFVMTQTELDTTSRELARRATDDPLFWFAYPKATSRRYQCEFNRDRGWRVMLSQGYDSVRSIAIDQDWSALRFRRTVHIGIPSGSSASRRSQRGFS